MEESEIVGAFTQPLKVLVIDATINAGDFEYADSAYIFGELARRNIATASFKVERVYDSDELSETLEHFAQDFSALLLVAHGYGPENNQIGQIIASGVVIGKDENAWQLLQKYLPGLQDKILALCVCEGFNDDSVMSTVQGEVMPLFLVGTTLRINSKSAREFFPALFEAIQSKQPIDLATLQQIVSNLPHSNGIQVTA